MYSWGEMALTARWTAQVSWPVSFLHLSHRTIIGIWQIHNIVNLVRYINYCRWFVLIFASSTISTLSSLSWASSWKPVVCFRTNHLYYELRSGSNNDHVRVWCLYSWRQHVRDLKLGHISACVLYDYFAECAPTQLSFCHIGQGTDKSRSR